MDYLKGVTLSPGLPMTRKVLFNQNIALAHTSIVSKHGYFMYSSLLNTILDEAIHDVDCFLRAQDGAFYIENIHLLLDQWSKCVHEGGTVLSFGNFYFLKLTPIALRACSKKSKSTL